MQDFPAAHSMDTYWFAVDAEGNIGFFDSGENGAVPSFDAYSPEDIYEFIAKLPVDRKEIVRLATDGKFAADGADLESLWKDIRLGGIRYHLLLVLSSEEVIEELLPQVRLQFSGSDTVVYVDECTAEKVRNLVESGKILRGKSDFYLFKNAHVLGLYLYYHDWGGIPAPYERFGVPNYPLKLEDLPSELQEEIGNVCFDSIRFSEVTEIQPIEHTSCDTWYDTPYWLDTKREREEWQKIRPEDKDFLEYDMQDFPAAHSMDTDWFAVDAEGNVGFFDSGENGAVPSSIHSSLCIDKFIAKLPVDSKGIAHLGTDGKFAADGVDLEDLWISIRFGGTMYHLLLVLSSEQVIEELLPHVCLQFSGSDTVVYLEECSAEKVKNLVESGKILRGKSEFYFYENSHILGVFPYKYDDWTSIPAPYKRLDIPTYQLKFDVLTSELQHEIGQVHFDSIRFSEVIEIQPIEHTSCNTYYDEPYWLDTKRERKEWQEYTDCWVAVDVEGNIGFFISGEDGAVPSSILSCFYIDDFIAGLPADSQGIINLAADGSLAADGADLESLWKVISYSRTIDETLLVLSSQEVIEEMLPHVRLRFSGSDTVVYVYGCSAEKVRSLIEVGKILRGKTCFSLFENTHILGVFQYNHDDSCGIPAPYKRLDIPIYPLKFDSLSSKLQREIGNIRFDSIRFMEAKEIQPIEHLPCITWRSTPYWLDTKRERAEWQEIEL